MPTANAAVSRLRELARENFVNSANKLLQLARRKGIPATSELARLALTKEVGKQIIAPPPRSVGQSAAEQPGSRLQADLIDFSKNTHRQGYALMLTDVFTRKSWAEPLQSKDAAGVKAATEHVLEEVPQHGQGATISTDQGKEFAGLNAIEGVIHRTKVNGEANSLAVVDRRMQELKQMMARDATTKRGYNWQARLAPAVHALNDNYTAAVHGAPDDVGKDNSQTFLVFQDNARKFEHNQAITDKRVGALEQAGAYRPPITTGGRSFKPGYGELRELAGVEPGNRFVTDTQGRRNLVSLAKPVEKGSEEAQGQLTMNTKFKPRPRGIQKVVGTPMKGTIPLAAGQPVEGLRHRVRLTVKTAVPKQATPAHVPTPGGSSSSKAPPEIAMPKFSRVDIDAYTPKTSPEERAAKAVAAKLKKGALEQAKKERQAQKETKANAAAAKAQQVALKKLAREMKK